jgi:hypothetical protein
MGAEDGLDGGIQNFIQVLTKVVCPREAQFQWTTIILCEEMDLYVQIVGDKFFSSLIIILLL